MIKCEICKKEFKRINSFHLKLHNIKNEKEYLLLFPNAKLYDEDYIKTISETTKIGMRKEESWNKFINHVKNRNTEQYRDKMSKAIQKKHKDKNYHDKIYTKDRNEKISIAKIEWHKNHPEFKIKMSKLYLKKIEKVGYEVFKKQCQIASKKGFLANEKRKGFNKFELNLYNKLIKENIKYISQYELENKYYDAYLPEYNLLLEFDGNFYHKDSLNDCQYNFQIKNYKNDKFKNNLAKVNNFNIIRIKENDNIENIKIFIENKLNENLNENKKFN